MNIGLGYALFVSVVCAFFGWTNYGFVNLQTTKPVVCGALVGLILGDLRTGIIIGGTLTLVYMGVQGVGAAIPVNATTASKWKRRLRSRFQFLLWGSWAGWGPGRSTHR